MDYKIRTVGRESTWLEGSNTTVEAVFGNLRVTNGEAIYISVHLSQLEVRPRFIRDIAFVHVALLYKELLHSR